MRGAKKPTNRSFDWVNRAVVISVIVAGAAYLGAAMFSGWGAVLEAIAAVGTLGIIAALTLSLINYLLRYLRWQVYLRRMGHRLPNKQVLPIYLAGFALTTTPGKAGEAVRGIWLNRLNVPYTDTFAAFINERFSDLLAIVLLALLGLHLFPKLLQIVLLGAVFALLVPIFLIWAANRKLPVLITRRLGERLHRLTAHIHSWIKQSRRCLDWRTLLITSALSIIGWLAEVFAFALILHWIGYTELPFLYVGFVFSIAMLAGAISFMPGGLGSTEAAMIALLVSGGIDLAGASAATLLIRLTTLWFAVCLGLLAQPFVIADQRKQARC